MKFKPQPATGEEDGDGGGETILHSKRTAGRVFKSSSSSREIRSVSPVLKSECKGPIEQALRNYDGPTAITIFSRRNANNAQLSHIEDVVFRRIFFTDEVEVIHPEDSPGEEQRKVIELTAFFPKNDEPTPDKKINVEQLTYENGRPRVVLQQLSFGNDIIPGKEYEFKGCGDEEFGIGKRNLHVRFLSLDGDIWKQYIRASIYHGCDKDVQIDVTETNLRTGFFIPRTDLLVPIWSQLESSLAFNSKAPPCNSCLIPNFPIKTAQQTHSLASRPNWSDSSWLDWVRSLTTVMLATSMCGYVLNHTCIGSVIETALIPSGAWLV